MKVQELAIPGVMLIEPRIFGDERGFFLESFNADRYRDAGVREVFVQDNLSRSRRGVVRGLHLQYPHPQGKLVQVLEGEVFDVAVDVRVGSPNFGKWVGERLSSSDKRQLYVPPGFAHGFQVLSENALFSYKCTDDYHPEAEICVVWDDPDIAIHWPLRSGELSKKDEAGLRLFAIEPSRLPQFSGDPR